MPEHPSASRFQVMLGLVALLVTASIATPVRAGVWKLGMDAARTRCTLSAAFGNGLILAFGLGIGGRLGDEPAPLGLVIVRPSLWPVNHNGPFLVTMTLDDAYLSLQATVSSDRRAVHVPLPRTAIESFARSRKLGLAVADSVQSFVLADIEAGLSALDGCNRRVVKQSRPLGAQP